MLKIISYNIHSGVGTDEKFSYARIGKFLASQDADIVCLQEMDLRDPKLDKAEQIQALLAGHFTEFIPSPAVVTDHGYYGNAILSRVKKLQSRSVDISVESRQPRNIQDVLFDFGSQKLRVLNTHKGLKQYERMAQFEQLENVVDEILNEQTETGHIPLLVTGDFNEWQFFPKSLKRINKKLHAHKLGATFPSKFPLFKLDRFWSKPAHIVHRAGILKTPETRYFSDHYPIFAELSLL
uniref:endonuclease/exonuclease/phosphatase family protein n=1 Tax=Ningiella ruwaisensis TaxID=2364274 RepID=UPI001F4FF286|nr:endonuclease/exonuclease/phosphatase family protein [Ningiella ruwaisensis]